MTVGLERLLIRFIKDCQAYKMLLMFILTTFKTGSILETNLTPDWRFKCL